MGKRHFIISVEGKKHKCYLDEDGRIAVIDDKGEVKATKKPRTVVEIHEAKSIAKVLIESLEK